MGFKYYAEITKDVRDNDIPFVAYDNVIGAAVYVSQNGLTDNGYRIVAYNAGEGRAGQGVGGSLELVTYEESAVNTTTPVDLAAADVTINALNASDGYRLIWNPATGPSHLLEARPAAWKKYHESYVDSRENGHGRTDTDRY